MQIATLTSLNDTIGKTITTVYESGAELYIRFSDDTVLNLEASEETEGFGYPKLSFNTWETILREDDLALCELGFTTRDAYEVAKAETERLFELEWAERERKQKLEYEEAERRRYLELQKKYGSGN